MTGKTITPANLGTRESFADIAATVLDYLNVPNDGHGTSML